MFQFGTIPTSEFLYLITNVAIDAIQAVVHTVNTKLRKLKKSLTKLDNLSKTVGTSAQNVFRGRSHKRPSSEAERHTQC